MSLQGEEEEEANAVRMAAILRVPDEGKEGELLVPNASTTKKEVNVKSLESNRLRRLSMEADKLKNATGQIFDLFVTIRISIALDLLRWRWSNISI